jgi:mycothione reductase
MREYDLIVVGAGSGNMIFGPELDDWKCAIVEEDKFGGTCLHRGCVPSKMYVVAADVARAVQEAAHLDVRATYDGVEWERLRDRIFGRIDPTDEHGAAFRRRNGVDVFRETARFVAPKVLEVGGEQLTARHIVVAVGSRPWIAPIPGLDTVPYLTSNDVMRIDALPTSMIVIGGGFVAAEMSHVFSSFGTDVTVLQRGELLLMAEDVDVSTRFTELVRHRMGVATGVTVQRVETVGGGVRVTWVDADGHVTTRDAERLLVATGRTPNHDRIDAAAGGLAVDEHGHISVDAHFRTSVDGVWAFGDVANHTQLKHMANAEMRVLQHNLVHPDDLRTLGHSFVPHAVFAHPQVAAVGMTESAARESGRAIRVASRNYAETAYGWALEDTTSFVKVIADDHDRTLLGAHVIGPDAVLLLQPLLQAMMLGQTADQVAHDVLYVHPALTEVVEQALLALEFRA